MDSVTAYRIEQAKQRFLQKQYTHSSGLCDLLFRDGHSSPELLHLKASNLINLGQLANAKPFLDQCIEVSPKDKKVWLDLGYIFASQGDDINALLSYQKSIDLDPSYSPAHNGIAVVYAKQGNTDLAVSTLRRVLRVNPDDIISAENLARLLEGTGQLADAIEVYRDIVKRAPTSRNYLSFIAACQKLNLSELSLSLCRDALRKYPRNITLRRIYFQLNQEPVHIEPSVDKKVKTQIQKANGLLNSNKIKLASQIFENLYRNHSDHPVLLYNYGVFCLQHTDEKKHENGLSMLNQSILSFPDFIHPYVILARYFFSQNDFEYVILLVKEALQYNKNVPDLYHILGMALKETKELKEAIQVMEQGIQIENGKNVYAMYADLGILYATDKQFAKAKKCYEIALKDDPSSSKFDYYKNKFNYGLLLSRSGMLDESIEVFESLPSLDRNAYEALLYTIACHPDKHRHLKKYLEDWACNYASHVKLGNKRKLKNQPKRIRIGYVSPDFRNHPVSYFMSGPYTHHNKREFEIYSYYNGSATDEYTLYLKSCSDFWQDVRSLSDQQLIDQVISDEIDILVDLSGHTTHNRLPVFVGKPAPIQVTYLGYLTTTGISQMDYRIIDSYATPDICTEKLIELPNCYLCYQPHRLNISTSFHAKSRNGYVTFGSFHRLEKIHQGVISVWSEILTKTANSVLLMKSQYLDSPDIQARLLQQFVSNGVDPSQIIFRGHADSPVSHLSSYDDIDIMLDTFPYNGTTITCESLWMGVPVVTLVGDLHLSRIGVSINTNAGLDDLIGEDESNYVRIAVELAQDDNRLLAYNATLRNQFLKSKVCDPVAFTKNLEAAYIDMYKRWQDNN